MQNLLYQRMYGKSANINLNESSVDKGMLIEYAEFLDIDENVSIVEPPTQSNNIAIIPQTEFGSIETEPITISTTSVQLLPNVTPTKAITKQIETRRADGKRRITPMFIPLSSEQES